jgi:hypothetical protein
VIDLLVRVNLNIIFTYMTDSDKINTVLRKTIESILLQLQLGSKST